MFLNIFINSNLKCYFSFITNTNVSIHELTYVKRIYLLLYFLREEKERDREYKYMTLLYIFFCNQWIPYYAATGVTQFL